MTFVTEGTCPDPELLTAFVDDELDRADRGAVSSHLDGCATCVSAVGGERRMLVRLGGLRDPEPSADLTARLLAIPASDGQVEAPVAEVRSSRMPTFFAAAASVVVLMVGAFAFIGASTQDGTSPNTPTRTTAIVPAADRLAQEHAVTAVSAGLGGTGMAVTPASLSQTQPPADAR